MRAGLPVNISTDDFSKRNVWPLSTGELGCRAGLTEELQLANPGRGCFSVQNPATGEAWHYVVEQAKFNAYIYVYDENLSVFQIFNTLSTSDVEVVTVALCEGQIMISSPSFATIQSVVGGALRFSVKGTSLIPDRVVLDIPRGLTIGWATRCVIATKTGLFISDALQPEVFDPVNVLDPPGGDIYGMHVSAGGSLVIATTEGVWALPEDAASSADVYGVWSQLTTSTFHTYNSTCSVHGELYGLTQRGLRRIDTSAGQEVFLNEKITAATDTAWSPVNFPDFRLARIYEGAKGPIVAAAGGMLMTDTTKNVTSWWRFADAQNAALEPIGVLRETDGSEMYVTSTGAYRYGGSRDISVTASTDILAAPARLFGAQGARPVASNVIRNVDFSTDASVSMLMSIPNQTYNFASLPQPAPVIGTGTWGDVYAEPLLRSRRGNFAARLDELDVMVRVSGPLARLGGSIDVWSKGPGQTRRTG